MIARVLQGEIDGVRMSLDDAVDVARGSVVPALRDQEGYRGMYLLLADEGKQIETFTAIYRAAPGRETYRVALADTPAAPSVFPNDVADRLRQLRAPLDEAHRGPQKKIDSAIDELERKADRLYASF